MPSHHTIRALDVGYGNTKFVVDDRGTCRLFPSLAPRADPKRLRAGPMAERRTRTVLVDGQAYEVGPDSVLFPDGPVLHRNYIETPEYRALVYGALDNMQLTHVDLLVTGLPVYLHHSRAQRLKQLLTGRHMVREDTYVEIAEVAVIAQPVGGVVAHSQESEDWSNAQQRLRLYVDPGLFSLDWFVTRGLMEIPGLSNSIEGGVCEVLKTVAQELTRDCGESCGNLRRLDEGLRTGNFLLRGQSMDLDPYRTTAAGVATRAIRRMRDQLVSCLADIEEIVLMGGGASYFETALREQFPGCSVQTVRDPIFANVRGFQIIGRLLKQRKAA
ncbi:MAG: PRTRC system protein D [Steroidobacteraceae bacterium]